jgi:hypothetical protein
MRDFNNIQYILNKSPNDLPTWWESLSEDDQNYAMEILIEYRKLLEEPVVEDLSVAHDLLKRFML